MTEQREVDGVMVARAYDSYEQSLKTIVANLVSRNREGSYWDFKQDWPRDTEDLVHDVICLANNPEARRAYLIYGVSDDCAYCGVGADGRKNTQQLIDTLHSAHWSETYPSVEVLTLNNFGCEIDVIVIDPDDNAVPYYLSRDFGNGRKTVRAGSIYTRSQDVNTARNETATPLATEKLWRRRFGIDKMPMERLIQLMKRPEDWTNTYPSQLQEDIAFSYCYYHKDYPEFTFTRSHDEDRDGYEYFMLISPFFDKPYWWTAHFYYRQTMLCEVIGAYSDHLYVPAPELHMLHDSEVRWQMDELLPYGCYYQDSIELHLLRFELDDSKEGASALGDYNRLLETIPIFKDESERKEFESWIHQYWKTFKDRWERQDRFYLGPKHLDEKCSDGYGDMLVNQAKMSATLVELLQEYRWV
ncbi:ATP-binding protein [Berryella wangjianweii]|uniref:ATP-binding protein n=1 Tax=Berryella wangjianweii TaxID=2734634 RepID=A0A6M8J362_9ACTN|nr:ATP-binding protein [Berryella wangjianweii]QKF07063.1 ATP-binding protein [Berryella wangjianweii]